MLKAMVLVIILVLIISWNEVNSVLCENVLARFVMVTASSNKYLVPSSMHVICYKKRYARLVREA